MEINIMILVVVAVAFGILGLIIGQEKKNKINKVSEQNYPIGYDTFVSESREWAFKYIEDVQKTLIAYDKEIEIIMDNLNSKSTKQDYVKVVGRIIEAEENIKQLLPNTEKEENR
jgi:hypothetical protein